MFVSISPINLNQILKLATGLLFILVLGVVIPNESFACHKDVPHGPHTCDPPDPEPDPPPPDPTTLTECDRWLCIASVGKWHRLAARFYAEGMEKGGVPGSYTEIPPNDFGNIILASLTTADNYNDLCLAYDVLIFQWRSSKIKNLTWQSLVKYMRCGGLVIFEDPSNIGALTDGVNIVDINIKTETPLTIAFEPTCIINVPTLCGGLTDAHNAVEFDVDNNHMEFNETPLSTNPILIPFLKLPGEEGPIIGLYGELLDEDVLDEDVVLGRIVLTGPDNSFHGSLHHPNDPNPDAHHNQYELLFHEIDWLLGFEEE